MTNEENKIIRILLLFTWFTVIILALKFVQRKLARAASKFILPAQSRDFTYLKVGLDNNRVLASEYMAIWKANIVENNMRFYVHKLPLQRLNVFEIEVSAEAQDIIVFNTNDSCYEENLEYLFLMAQGTKCNIFAFNYRTVNSNRREGIIKQELIDDGKEVYRFVKTRRGRSNGIILYGHSLGAMIAIFVAIDCFKNNQSVKIFSDRAPASLSEAVCGLARTIFENPDKIGLNCSPRPMIGRILSMIIWPIVKIGLILLGWEMNVATAFREIPDDVKEYTVIRSKKEDRSYDRLSARHVDDLIIYFRSSLYAALSRETKAQKNSLKSTIQEMQLEQQFGKTIDEERLKQVQQRLALLKARKFNGSTKDSHGVPLMFLKSRNDDRTGLKLLAEFCHRNQDIQIPKF